MLSVDLHYVFDLWVQHWRKQPGRGEVIVLRYADDSVVGFENVRTARAFLEDLRERLAKFGLTLHPDKTRLIEFGRFAAERRRARAGQTGDVRLLRVHALLRNRPTRKVPGRATDGQEADASDVNRDPGQALPTPTRTCADRWRVASAGPEWLLRVPCSNGFRDEVCRAWRHALLRRSQRHQLNWSRFTRLTSRYVPSCRVLHPYPEERFFASRP